MGQDQAPTTDREVQQFFTTPRPSREQRRTQGMALRARVPLESLADLPAERSDPMALLAQQERVLARQTAWRAAR